MSFRVETVILSPGTDQYAGRGQRAWTLERVAAAARNAEALGFDGVCAPEAGHDPVPAARRSPPSTPGRIHLGTNVAIAFPRSPMVTAQLAWDLQQLSGGRFNLGLGTQVKGHNELRYATPWTARPGPASARVRAVPAGDVRRASPTGKADAASRASTTRSACCRPSSVPGRSTTRAPPIYIAAVNTYMATPRRRALRRPPPAPDRHVRLHQGGRPAGDRRRRRQGRPHARRHRRHRRALPRHRRHRGRRREGRGARSSSTSPSTPRPAPTTPCSRFHGWEDIGAAAPPALARGQVAGAAEAHHRRDARRVGRSSRPTIDSPPRCARAAPASSRPCSSTCPPRSPATRIACASIVAAPPPTVRRATMAEQHVLFEVDQGVGVVTLNRPERLNAVNWDHGDRAREPASAISASATRCAPSC